MCRDLLGPWRFSFCAQFSILWQIPNVVRDHIFWREGLWRAVGVSGFSAWNVATLGAEFQAGAGPERDVKYRERGLWETAAGRLSRANPAQARDRVPRFRPAGPVSTPSRKPLPPFGLKRCGLSLRANPQRGRMVVQAHPSRPKVWPSFRSRFEVRQRRNGRAALGIRQCAEAPSRCGDLFGRACAGLVLVQGQALLHCASFRCDRRRCTRPIWAVALISRNRPTPKGAPQ